MLFNSLEFLLFLPIVFALYWLMSGHLRVQNVLVVAASYVFYGWWDTRFLLLIAGMTLTSYAAGRVMGRMGTAGRGAKAVCAANIVVCLGVLCAFKYYDFFVLSLQSACNEVGWSLHMPLWHVVLPVGISFYTFQALSYTIDVRRGHLPPCRDLVAFAAYISFFPQLVAGPIERATRLLPQFSLPRRFSPNEAVCGLRQMLWGFVKKMLVADNCAALVDAIYANPAADGTDLWMAAVLFAFQIYGDFSGYSDIAIGTARLFGISLMRNFDNPYLSRNIADFWRRWHISLTTWFRDYLYIPLSGSRRGRARTLANTAIVFLASGLWHGAAWTFVAWGGYHALLFVPLVLRRGAGVDAPVAEQGSGLRRAGQGARRVAAVGFTFVAVCVGWVLFRSETLTAAASRLLRMFTDVQLHVPYGGRSALLFPLLMMVAEWLMRQRRHGLDLQGHGLIRFRAARWLLYYALIALTLVKGGAAEQFIYFQF